MKSRRVLAMQISPAILTDSLATFAQQLDLVKQEVDIEIVQIDVIDALFTNNVTVNPSDLLGFDFGKLSIDFHLMTEEPMDYVWELIECGKRLPTRSVIGQIEKMSYQLDFLEEIRKADWKAGLALDLFTPLESIDDASWEYLDHVLLMAVEAGQQGQDFNGLVFDKIKELKILAQKLNKQFKISVDGGVKNQHIKLLKKVGVDQVAVGSGLFNAENFNVAFNNFKKEIL
jgi:ribulose-phosphate 3-epimerase